MVEERALLRALGEGQLGGAVLDAFRDEPLPPAAAAVPAAAQAAEIALARGEIEGVQIAVAAGGQLVMAVTDMGPIGSIGFFLDSEGNRIGVHKPPQA